MAVERRSPSQAPGMGARLIGEWCAFRVWAPFAREVAVAGSFNGWQTRDVFLWHEGGGYWSVEVRGVRAGDEYRYVITGVNGETLWRIDPYARETTSSVGNAVVTSTDFDWGPAQYSMPAWHELVIYELHVGTFNDAPGGGPGNFDSVIERLDYLRDLGVNAIEVMPSMEFATDFSWGYNPAHPFAIERAYGGPAALQRLVRAAHERGLAVVADVVYNHFGPSDLDMWRVDGWGENGKGGVYFYNDWRSYTRWGDTRPDYGRSEVRQYLRDNALMWLEDYRVDGLRWDATSFIHNVYGLAFDPFTNIDDGWRLMQAINTAVHARQPWKPMIAEDMQRNPRITQPPGEGGAGFSTQWDAEFVQTVREELIRRDDGWRNMANLARVVEGRYESAPLRRVIYTESHDEVANGKARLPEDIWPGNADSWFSRKRSALGAVLVFTSPGIPMIFQGQEFLEDEWFRDGAPLDWDRVTRFAGIVALYRSLCRLRRNWFDTTRGLRGSHVNVFHVNHQDKVLAFHRWENGGPRDDVVVLANFANHAYDAYAVGLPRGGEWRVRFNSDAKVYGTDFGNAPSHDFTASATSVHGFGFSGILGLGRYSAVILSQD